MEEKEQTQIKPNYFQWIRKPFNWIMSVLLTTGELSSHFQQQDMSWNVLEFIVVFALISNLSYHYGWFWNWFTKPLWKK